MIKQITNIPETYEIAEQHFSTDLNSVLMLLRHKKTGARVALISNDDENKVFYIGFRTPVDDSTGVPHIIEHSVLCGSENFPLKDPFVELAKGSLNTFLNAMTFPDKTVYPVASCNDKDFRNLMHVYLDAVFHPNIYKHKEIFMQEGWHYEMESEDSDLSLNGVVYSEMKGAFSSPDDVMDRQIATALFPDITYAKESGGDPDDIPSLTYEGFLDFHRRYYHPTNSYIYLYGNMDMADNLKYIDEEYLSNYDCQTIDSEIKLQAPFEKPVEKEVLLPVTTKEEEEEGTVLTYNVCLGENSDPELYFASRILDYAICSAPGAPLKTALVDKNIGKDVYSSYENGIRQQFFSIVARDTEVSKKEEFLSTIREVLTGIVKNGFDEKPLRAAISRLEFSFREADFGSYPKGLVYGLQMLDSWLYDDAKPFLHIEVEETFRKLKENVKNGYYEKLVKDYLLDNPHCAVVIGIPKAGLALEKEEQLKKKLADYKASLSAEEIRAIIKSTADLKVYQETPDSEEALATIPLLEREDLRKEITPLSNAEGSIDGSKVLSHDIFTNGIAYITVSFDTAKLPYRLYPHLSLVRHVLGLMDTKEYKYSVLVNETDLYTGALVTDLSLNHNFAKDSFEMFFETRTKVLYDNIPKAFELMKEILFFTAIDDEKRLHEIIREIRSRSEASVNTSGHVITIGRVRSYFSKGGAISELISGVGFHRFLQDLDDHFEEKKAETIRGMKEAMKIVMRPENMILDIISPKEMNAGIEKEFVNLKSFACSESFEAQEIGNVEPVKKNEGFSTSSDVQYVCKGGLAKDFPYTGAFRVLHTILGYDYLWMNVRVKGGAYGCISSFQRSGSICFVSYRDPNLKETIAVFDKVPEYIENFEADEKLMTKYIIGTLSDEDIPKSPAALGSRSLKAYRMGITEEQLQKERDEMLTCTAADINALAPAIREVLSQDNLCVLGAQSAIEANSDVFMSVETII